MQAATQKALPLAIRHVNATDTNTPQKSNYYPSPAKTTTIHNMTTADTSPVESSSQTCPRQVLLHENAQQLNNHAANFMEVGKLDEAIDALALLLESLRDFEAEPAGDETSRVYCLDECIKQPLETGHTTPIASILRLNRHRNDPPDRKRPRGFNFIDRALPCIDIHYRPIRVITGGQSMGGNFHAIVTYNPALAFHLRASFMTTTIAKYEVSTQRQLQRLQQLELRRALALYELAYEIQRDQNTRGPASMVQTNADESKGSVYFQSILLNNVGHIHLLMNNPVNYKRCVEKSISIEATKLVRAETENDYGDKKKNNDSFLRKRSSPATVSFDEERNSSTIAM